MPVVFLIIALLVLVFSIVLPIGLALGVIFLIWKLYGLVIPYFFGGFVPTIHSPGYNLVHPHFWPFLGIWVLLIIVFTVFMNLRSK